MKVSGDGRRGGEVHLILDDQPASQNTGTRI